MSDGDVPRDDYAERLEELVEQLWLRLRLHTIEDSVAVTLATLIDTAQ